MSLSVLRGWSIAVTLLEGTDDVHWRGGGYFLKWEGKGIVIDPGFDFVDNFHDAKFHANEIDAILVSHNHSDHNFDLRAIDDLKYQLYYRSPGLPPSVVILDEDSAIAFGDELKDHRNPPSRFTRADYYLKRWYEECHTSLPATIEHFPVRHGDDVPHAVGLRIRLKKPDGKDFVIGYTGDTTYFLPERSGADAKTPDPEPYCQRYLQGLAKELEGCDLLIAHISQPSNEEFNNETHYKEVHLGYNGVTRLIREAKPTLTLVGEFWAGLADLRIELIQGLRERTGTKAILPAGLGMHVRLPSLEVECTQCRKATAYDKIRITPPTRSFGPLGFVCDRCMI